MIPKISSIVKPTVMSKVSHNNVAKKVMYPVAGLTGLSILPGSCAGPDVPPPGYNIIRTKDSIDDGMFESLVDKLKRTANLALEDTPLETPLKEFVAHAGDTCEHVIEGLKDFGQSIIESCSEQL